MLDSLSYSMGTDRKHRDGLHRQTQEKEYISRCPLNKTTTLGCSSDTPRQRTHTLISILLGHASGAKWGNSCAELQKKHSQRGCGCNFSSFDHADQMHALKGWNHCQPPTCCISLFCFVLFFSSLSKCCHASFFKVSGGRHHRGFIADIGDKTRNP